MSLSIEIIPSQQIDNAKWDACIRNSSNGLIYATSFYLNSITDNWHGIVVNDYDVVMPVPWRKKFGIRYCYDVPFIQQFGFYYLREMKDSFPLLKKLFNFCKYGDYAFNFSNRLQVNKTSLCTNFILELFQPYDLLSKKYNTDLINNLKKAYKQELVYSKGEYNATIDLYKDIYKKRMPHLSNNDFENFRKLCSHLSKDNNVIVRNVTAVNNELLATALLLKDERRLYNIMNSTTNRGRKTEANHFLFDNIFKEFAESHLIFDFEGSDIPGIKSFYEKFGAKNQSYYKLHFNYLPVVIKWLKH